MSDLTMKQDQERPPWESPMSIAKLAAAFVKAQADIEGATKDKINPHFRSSYADLSSVVDAIKPALVANGLAFVQVCHDDPSAAKVETIILHSSGEYLSCGVISVPVSKADAQGYGSALTYARRYSLSAAFGVAPEDDDGNAAAKSPPVKSISKEQAANIQSLVDEVKADLPKFLGFFGVRAISAIPASEYEKAVTALERKRSAA